MEQTLEKVKPNYVIKSQRLAGYLMQKGFKLHKIEESDKNSQRNVFIFTTSNELLEAIEKYKTTK